MGSAGQKSFFEGLSAEERTLNAMKFLDRHVSAQKEIAMVAAKSEKLNTIKRQFRTIDSLVSNPLCCGYLLQYARSDSQGALVDFIVAVYSYKELFSGDEHVWNTGWREVDTMVKIDDPAVEQVSGADRGRR